MSEDDITILPSVLAITGQKGRLYYYQGNFYYPLALHGSEIGRVRKAIREFTRQNKQLIEADRSSSSYRTIVEIFDDQFASAL